MRRSQLGRRVLDRLSQVARLLEPGVDQIREGLAQIVDGLGAVDAERKHRDDDWPGRARSLGGGLGLREDRSHDPHRHDGPEHLSGATPSISAAAGAHASTSALRHLFAPLR